MQPPAQNPDIIVVGSGAAALSAALTAAQGGATVVVLEKSDKVGGTTAMSGAGIWAPANHIARAAGFEDSEAETLEYLRATAPPGWAETEDSLWASYAEAAPKALELIDQHTPIKFEITPEPDPMAEYPGGKREGRMLSPKVIRRGVAGKFGPKIRRSTLPHLFTYVEGHEIRPYAHPIRAVLQLLPKLIVRLLTNARGQGNALVAGLISGCLDHGVEIKTSTPVIKLITDEVGGVSGVMVDGPDGQKELYATRGVVLATGGFDWDDALRETHFPGPFDRIGSPRTNTGDGQRMAADIGAELAHMDQANVYATLPTKYEGHVHGMPMTFHGPRHLIVVNREAKRFGSELDHNLGEYIDARDPQSGAPMNLPCWMIADQQYIKGSGMFRWYARKLPGWMRSAATLEELAQMIDLPAENLVTTVRRYNAFAAAGSDGDFQRGANAWETYKSGGKATDKRQVLGSIEKGPFIAVPMNRSILATKGGPRTDAHGQVTRADGTKIAGLYCAGVAMANPIGTRAVGAGTTLGPCLTWGYICAKSLLRSNR